MRSVKVTRVELSDYSIETTPGISWSKLEASKTKKETRKHMRAFVPLRGLSAN